MNSAATRNKQTNTDKDKEKPHEASAACIFFSHEADLFAQSTVRTPQLLESPRPGSGTADVKTTPRHSVVEDCLGRYVENS